ncbi:MAG TPA: hypothetical protein VJN96_11765, partial [Vicinamibacterales bacterium]|nr:hypothetical protein [Vicinamibacterales bacterium]
LKCRLGRQTFCDGRWSGACLIKRVHFCRIEIKEVEMTTTSRRIAIGSALVAITFVMSAYAYRPTSSADLSVIPRPLGAWTQAAMRGTSAWTIGERELMAAMVAKWNSCAFCLGAHSAVAATQLPRATVDAAVAEYRAAPIPDALKATLVFLEKMTRRPGDLTAEDARTVLRAGVSREALTDALAVASVFNIITRYADALDFAIPTPDEFDRAARMLVKRGYGT